jgi:release factor glutamine methyltransferase
LNIQDKFIHVVKTFKSHGIVSPEKEAEILFTETIKTDKSSLYAGTVNLNAKQSADIDKLADRRINGEPLQYIIGHVDFMGLKIYVGRGVLIPRPETELLAEEAIKILSSRITHHALRATILDLCTGSGCLALAIARAFPSASVYGVDISAHALDYALKNAAENNIENVDFVKGDLFEPLGGMSFDCIVSNPPYIRTSEIQGLQTEIKNHEPLNALDGGEDGLDFYRSIIGQSSRYLKKSGIIALELGFEQSEDLHAIALCSGFSDVSFIKDYSGINRICIIKK